MDELDFMYQGGSNLEEYRRRLRRTGRMTHEEDTGFSISVLCAPRRYLTKRQKHSVHRVATRLSRYSIPYVWLAPTTKGAAEAAEIIQWYLAPFRAQIIAASDDLVSLLRDTIALERMWTHRRAGMSSGIPFVISSMALVHTAFNTLIPPKCPRGFLHPELPTEQLSIVAFRYLPPTNELFPESVNTDHLKKI